MKKLAFLLFAALGFLQAASAATFSVTNARPVLLRVGATPLSQRRKRS